MKFKKIVVCADDFALNNAVSKAILDLLKTRCINATSCMTTSPLWPQWGSDLKPLAADCFVGIHLDITQFMPLSATSSQGLSQSYSIAQTILRAYSRRLSLRALTYEFEMQLQHFCDVMGQHPQFIDGHQHIHQFPIIRDALILACKHFFKTDIPSIRLVNGYPFLTPLRDSFAKIVIHALGRNKLQRALIQEKIPYYSDFKGIYVFKGTPNLTQTFSKFLEQIQDKGILMCHPGYSSTDEEDPIRDLREQEYTFLKSNTWQQLLHDHHIQLDSKDSTQ